MHEYKYKIEKVAEKLYTKKAKEIASKRMKTAQLYYDSLIEELEETYKGKMLIKKVIY